MRSWGREAGGRKAAVEQGCFKVFLGPLRSLLFSDLWALLQMKSSAASASEPLIIKEPGPTLRLWSLHDLSDDATFLQLGSLPPSSLDPAPLFSLLSITLMPCRVSWGCAQRSMSLPFPPPHLPFPCGFCNDWVIHAWGGGHPLLPSVSLLTSRCQHYHMGCMGVTPVTTFCSQGRCVNPCQRF